MKKTIADYPELVKEWHPTKNGDVKPNNVISGSHKKYWWVCSKNQNHIWKAVCKSRTNDKRGCPYCANKKVCKDNCLSTTHPELSKEWHPTKNGDVTPNNVISGSHKKYWWVCSKNQNHIWKAVCKSRTNDKRGCPYCANRQACIDNCLATTHPELVKEWHPTKNGDITPNDVTSGSNKKYWWICSKNHIWKAVCKSRTNDKTGCPYCANKKVCKDNCLSTTHPELSKEWHPTKNVDVTPNDVISGSHKKYWWACSKNHVWKADCSSRTDKNKRGCPYCANKKVCKDNCLATTHPELVKEWHPTKNGDITPNNVISGSHKKYWWVCSKNQNHIWKAVCKSRAFLNSGCPICCESKGEKEIARILDNLNIKYKREYKFNKCKNKKSLPFDFVIYPNKKIKIIEYHGIQHYSPVSFGGTKIDKYENLKGIQKRDKIKKDFCESRGIPFLEINYNDYDKIEELIKKFLVL